MEYKTLEPNNLKALGVTAPSFNGGGASFYATSSFVYTLFFIAIVTAAFYRYALAGMLRMEASETGIRKSNEIFKRVTLGLLGVFSLFLLLFTVNKGLVTGDVGLSGLAVKGVSNSGSVVSQPISQTSGGSGTSRACDDTASVISRLTSSGGICSGTICTVLTGCNYQQYLPIIEQETGGDLKLKKMVIVTMCRESRGNVNAQNSKNGNGTFDCGLMQINQRTPCDQTIFSPSENIKKGVALMRSKIAATSQIYPNIPKEAGTFASYNCCANGTVPNAPSADCTQASGFPYTIPKWACPINPGDSSYNMCSVKGYACELSACMNAL